MKKVLVLMLALVMALSLVACGGTPADPVVDEVAPPENEQQVDTNVEDQGDATVDVQVPTSQAITFDEEAEAPDLTGKTVIACIGDSITAGGYPNDLQALIDAEYENYAVYNFGEPGAILTSGDRFTYTDMPAFAASVDVKADVYIIMFGTNDTQARLTVDEASIREVYGNLMDAYMNANEDAEVYIALSPYLYPEPGKDAIKFGLQLDVLQELVLPIVEELATQRGLTIIDTHEFTTNHAEWFGDGVHPNAEGAKEMAAHIFENISEGLK